MLYVEQILSIFKLDKNSVSTLITTPLTTSPFIFKIKKKTVSTIFTFYYQYNNVSVLSTFFFFLTTAKFKLEKEKTVLLLPEVAGSFCSWNSWVSRLLIWCCRVSIVLRCSSCKWCSCSRKLLRNVSICAVSCATDWLCSDFSATFSECSDNNLRLGIKKKEG